MKTKINILRDEKDQPTRCPTEYTDLVHNFTLFHEHFTSEKLTNLPDWDDDTNYLKFPNLDDFLSHKSFYGEIDPFDTTQTYVIRVNIEDFFSSEKSKGGGDRPFSQLTIGIKKAIQNLNNIEEDNVKGYKSEDADILGGFFRIVSHDGNRAKVVLVKHKGNSRTNMKLMVHKGESTEVLMKVSFHDKDADLEEMLRHESERHTTDAGDKTSENEAAAFASGLKAKRNKSIECFEFMKLNKLNYIKEETNIMELNGVDGHETFIPLKSLSGIKEGKGNGIFKTYEKKNVEFAIKSIQTCLEITKEQKEANDKHKAWVLNSTTMDCFAYSYSIWTKYGPKISDGSSPYFSVTEFDELLKQFFMKDYKNKKDSDYFGGSETLIKVNDFCKSGNVKNIPYISQSRGNLIFWINAAYKKKQGNVNNIGVANDAIEKIFKDIGDKVLVKDIKSILDND